VRPASIYLVLSALLIGSAVLAAGIFAGDFFQRHVAAMEEAQTAETVLTQARQHLTPAHFRATTRAHEADWQEYLRGLPGVFRIKVFDPSGTIVWSNEPRLIGKRFDNDRLAHALDGTVTTSLGHPADTEHVYERSHRYVAETYVPITFVPGRAASGVVETYWDATAMIADVHRTQRAIWLIAGVAGLILYLALAAIVRHARTREQRAIAALERRNRQLTLLQRFSEAALGPLDVETLASRMVRSMIDGEAVTLAALYRIGNATGEHIDDAAALALIAGAPTVPASPPVAASAVAVEGGPPLMREGAVAARLEVGGVRYVLVAEIGPDAGSRDVFRRSFAIMAHEAAIALSNAATIRELRDAQACLVEHERLAAVGELVVGLHHAILNPLTGALGALEVLRRDPGSPLARLAMSEAQEEIRRVERLVRGLPGLRRADGTAYVGRTRMLDLEGVPARGSTPAG
jgi:signal transduction histidine kinase